MHDGYNKGNTKEYRQVWIGTVELEPSLVTRNLNFESVNGRLYLTMCENLFWT
jgi:hypothetical protein